MFRMIFIKWLDFLHKILPIQPCAYNESNAHTIGGLSILDNLDFSLEIFYYVMSMPNDDNWVINLVVFTKYVMVSHLKGS